MYALRLQPTIGFVLAELSPPTGRYPVPGCLGSLAIGERELVVDGLVPPAVDLSVRVHEEVQHRALLGRNRLRSRPLLNSSRFSS